MDIKNKITRVAVAGLTIGALAVAGLGTAATAFADNGDGQGIPDASNDGGIQLPPGSVYLPPQVVYVDPNAYLNNYYYNQYYNNQPVYPTYSTYPVYPVYPVYPTYTYNYQMAQGIFATGTAELMGLPVSSITGELAQGKSLTQIAAESGWTRDYFLSLLVNRVQSDLIAGINNGSIDPSSGNALLANLIDQASAAIDQVGLQTYTPTYTPQSVYGVYPVAPY